MKISYCFAVAGILSIFAYGYEVNPNWESQVLDSASGYVYVHKSLKTVPVREGTGKVYKVTYKDSGGSEFETEQNFPVQVTDREQALVAVRKKVLGADYDIARSYGVFAYAVPEAKYDDFINIVREAIAPFESNPH